MSGAIGCALSTEFNSRIPQPFFPVSSEPAHPVVLTELPSNG